jgi:hypothetical protein
LQIPSSQAGSLLQWIFSAQKIPARAEALSNIIKSPGKKNPHLSMRVFSFNA